MCLMHLVRGSRLGEGKKIRAVHSFPCHQRRNGVLPGPEPFHLLLCDFFDPSTQIGHPKPVRGGLSPGYFLSPHIPAEGQETLAPQLPAAIPALGDGASRAQTE